VEGVDVDYRSDIFSFGVVLYELLTHVHPFASASHADTIYNIVHREPPLEALPLPCRRIVARCLAKEPGSRYQSMADVAHDLRDSFVRKETTSRGRRLPAWRVIAAVLFIGAVLVSVLVMSRQRVREKPAPQAVIPQRWTDQITNSGKIRSAAISPDGKFIVYEEVDRGLSALWVKQTATGSATRIVSPSSSFYRQITISPDSNYVYYAASKPPGFALSIYQVPILGGEPRVTIADGGASGFALSPDARHIAFFRYGRDGVSLTSASIDGSGERKIVTFNDPRYRHAPAWSPDGKSIAFVNATQENSEQQIEEIALQTRAQRRIGSFSRPIWTMTWLPDGSGMLVSDFEADGVQLWSVPAGGGAPTEVTTDVDSYVSPSLTADGKALLAVRAEFPRSIMLLSVDDAGRTRVTASGIGEHLAGEVRWIGAGRLVYEGIAEGVRTLFVVPAAGGQPRQIIRGMSASHPSVSPDGKRLAFISERSGSAQVWLSDIEGNAPTQLTSGGYPVRAVEFSADSAFVYYTNGWSAYRVPVSGGTPEDRGLRTNSGLALSRDGRWLMSVMYRDEGQRIYLFRLSSAEAVRTIPLPFSLLQYIRFHPSSLAVSFIARGENGTNNIWLRKIDGGATRQITNLDHGDIYAFDWSPDGKSLAVASADPRRDLVIIHNFR